MNKFTKNLTNSSNEIKEKRAGILSSSTKSAQEQVVNNIQNELNQTELEIENLTDIAPENTYDLRPGGKGFDPIKWADKLQELKVQQYTLGVELKIAKSTLTEWFSEDDIPL